MQNNISPLIPSQLSERTKYEYPLFVEFLELYYKYIQERTNAVGVIQNRHLDFDIDNTLDVYVDNFLDTYAHLFPKETALDKRFIVKILNELYNAKGTEKSFKLLYKILFNEDVSLSYPKEQILRASDGMWYQESFILASTISGDPHSIIDKETKIVSVNDAYYIKPIRVEEINESDFRIYFTKIANVVIEENDIVELFEYSSLLYRAKIKKSAAKIQILSPGQNFELGQIYSIVGSAEPTIFKIKAIDTNGGIVATEVINHGYEHTGNTITFISPYNAPPSSSDTQVNIVETSPGVFTIELNISDVVYDISEYISGTKTGNSTNSYFLQDYVVSDYNGSIIIDQTIKSESSLKDYSGSIESYGITIQDYLNSRAYVAIINEPMIDKRGAYKNNRGHLSDQSIRIQDNYYYQLFSYVINSGLDISKHKNTILGNVHPAGLKVFFDMRTEDEIDISTVFDVDGKYIYRLDVFDDVQQIELLTKEISKTEANTLTITDVPSKTVVKDETASATATESIGGITLSKSVPETITPDDSVIDKTISKTLADILESATYADTYFAELYVAGAGVNDAFDLQVS